MNYRGWIWLLFGALAWGQESLPAAPSSQMPGAAVTTSPAPEAPPSQPAQVPPDAAVITIQGICAKPPADPAKTTACQTVITREKFDRLVEAFAPNAPPASRRQLATQYAAALVMANEALKQGLDKTVRFQETLEATRLGLLAKELQTKLQEEAAQISDKDVEDYYHKNQAMFQEASLQRIFVPQRKQFDPPKEKLTDEQTQKIVQESEAAMKQEADSVRTRAAAGEDFDKLEQEVYTFAGFKTAPPSTKMNKVRRSTLPPDQAAIFELKTGEVSQVFAGPTGYAIYKVGEKDAIPLDKAKPEIVAALRSQRFQELRRAVDQSGTAVFNDAYFGSASATPPSLVQPGNVQPLSKPPHTGPK